MPVYIYAIFANISTKQIFLHLIKVSLHIHVMLIYIEHSFSFIYHNEQTLSQFFRKDCTTACCVGISPREELELISEACLWGDKMKAEITQQVKPENGTDVIMLQQQTQHSVTSKQNLFGSRLKRHAEKLIGKWSQSNDENLYIYLDKHDCCWLLPSNYNVHILTGSFGRYNYS